MNTGMRKLILRTDALILGVFGIFGLTMDLLSYFAGLGTWQQQFFNNPLAVGVVEAHGLAIMMSVLLLRFAGRSDRPTGHLLAATIHLLLGTANLIFWQAFLDTNQLPLGYITTGFHGLFVALNALCFMLPSEVNQTATQF
jgi:hypothetical protein